MKKVWLIIIVVILALLVGGFFYAKQKVSTILVEKLEERYVDQLPEKGLR